MKLLAVGAGLIVFGVCVVGVFYVAKSDSSKTPPEEYTGNELEKTSIIRVTNPRPNAVVQSPFVVEGEARGNWFFEASFPVILLDEAGNILGLALAQADDEWMTEEFVPFRALLEFETPYSGQGTLVLKKDNPSGLPEHEDQLFMPVMLGQKTL